VPADRRWFLVVLIPVGAALATVAIAVAMGAPTDGIFDRLLTPAALLIPMLVLLPAFTEEIAWRGYALPPLAARMSPLAAAPVVAVPWTAIHYVLHLPGAMNADAELWATTVSLVAISVILGWVYFGTRGSVLLAGLVHASFNAVVPIKWGVSDYDADLVLGVSALVTAGIAIAIVVLGGFRGRGNP
jgi:membrane protease YdiL (CAAX protease family)